MQTLYIDVYFLVNFTVDAAALFFAVKLTKDDCSLLSILIGAAVGAISACFLLLYGDGGILFLILLALSLVGTVIPSSFRFSGRRKTVFLICFLFFDVLLSGCVTLLYRVLDNSLLPFLSDVSATYNRKLLRFSAVLLIGVGLAKMIASFFIREKEEKSVDLEILLAGKKIELSAFIDTGNVVKDPFDASPVVWIAKNKFLSAFTECSVLELSEENIPPMLRERLRPIVCRQCGISLGFRPDAAFVFRAKRKEAVKITVAIHPTESDFCGYSALASPDILV